MKLTDFFEEKDLEWKPQTVGKTKNGFYAMVLCYVQARAIQNRLDEVFGWDGWKDEYRFEKEDCICRLSCKNEKGEWIAKENGAPQTDIESFKGGISGAFKRVASSGFGIGRYLYDLDTTWADVCTKEEFKGLHSQLGWNKAKVKTDAGYEDFYWKTPSIDKKFLPKKEAKQESRYKETLNGDGIDDIFG